MHVAKVLAWMSGVAMISLGVTGALSEEALNSAALAKSLGGAKITLQQGMAASEREGQTTSAKFEVEDGKLQLSVYAAKAGKYSEVVVDHVTGAITKVEPITRGDDLKQARAQSASLAGVKTSLRDAADKAEAQSPGFRAVSVTPSLKDKHAVATVELLKSSQMKAVIVPLS